MGSGFYKDADWKAYSSTTRTKTREENFTSRSMKDEWNPLNIKVRESRDSENHPESNAMIIAFDVSGSMGRMPQHFVTEGFGVLMDNIFNKNVIPHPQVCMMAVGDMEHDRSPLQVSQFESDIRIVEQLQSFHLEGGGGSNWYESYAAVWYFAAMHTSIDCFEKRNKKGILFTIGDEEPTPKLYGNLIKQQIGDDTQDISPEEALKMAQRMYHVYHIIIKEGTHMGNYPKRTLKAWNELMGQNAIVLDDHTKLSELIVSILQLIAGVDKDTVLKGWDGTTAVTISNAIKNTSVAKTAEENNVVVFK